MTSTARQLLIRNQHSGRQARPSSAPLNLTPHGYRALLWALGLLVCSRPVLSDDEGWDTDRLNISAGGYAVYQFDSDVSFTETNAGVGVSFSPRDTLDLDNEDTVFRMDGSYRLASRHALTFSWYRISSNSNRTLVDDIEWVDDDDNTVVIPIGTSVGASLDYDIFKVGYLWSFYQSDKVDLALGAGLHLARLGMGLSVEQGLFDAELREAKSDVPMPVLSFALEYSLTPRLDLYFTSQYFALDLGEWSGLYADTQLGFEYQLFRHAGAGLAFGSSSLEVVREYDNLRFDFDNRVSGLHFFVSANF